MKISKLSKQLDKTSQVILYLIGSDANVSVTSLMKLSYLADLMSVKDSGKQITTFRYKRYYFGPFDKKIYEIVEALGQKKLIMAKSNYSSSGQEYIEYSICEDSESLSFEKIKERDQAIIDELLDKLKGYGAKMLTEITYKTKPMKALKATLGGDENLNEPLNLKT